MTSGEKINILLVDDRPENLLALEAIIEREDYNLVKAVSGEEALKFLLKYDFAAILLDVQMPGIDGFETAKIIKAREKTKNIPILFITANNVDHKHIFTGYSVGAIDYILKPFDPFILKAKVEGFVELYKMNQKIIQQSEKLAEKSKELEKAYDELSAVTAELRVSEEIANIIYETSIDSKVIIDQDGFVLKVNPTVKKMFHYDVDELLGKNVFMLFTHEKSQAYIKEVLEAVKKVDMGNRELKEITATRKDGSTFPIEIQVGKKFVQDKWIVACTILDITKRKKDEEMITHMAYHDSLTGLANRRLFSDQLTVMLNKAKKMNQPLALMYLDMDRFKYINDSLGHLIGDKVIQEIAKRLARSVEEGGIVARVGGDEFTVLLPNTNREVALELAESILESFKKSFTIDNYKLFLTTSIGISIFPYDGEDSLSLVKNADAALYRAKEQGKNIYKVFHSGMNIQSYRTFMMQSDLRFALERDELELVYQPRVDIESKTISSAEALLRWNHPDWGTIFPSEFIPLAEENGQIVEMGVWVLKAVSKQLKEWKEAGYRQIRIAINFSAKQFLQKDLVDNIQHILKENRMSPNMLEIEITESVIMGNEPTITKTLNKLRKMGIFISIDDFGTGYSSLNYLRRFPVNTLKIDKSFIQDITNTTSKSISIVSTIISLAHSLNMSVIAEGVETEEQLNILKEHRCEEAQGYLFSRPVLPKDFEVFLLRTEDNNTDTKEISNRSTSNIKDDDPNIQSQDILHAALLRTKEKYSISKREMDVWGRMQG